MARVACMPLRWLCVAAAIVALPAAGSDSVGDAPQQASGAVHLGQSAASSQAEPATPEAEERSHEDSGVASKLEEELGVKKVFDKVKQEEQMLSQKLAPVGKAVSEMYKGLNQPDYNAPPTLEGNEPDVINFWVLVVVVSIVVVVILGVSADLFCKCKAMEDRPKLWAIALIVLSYILLIPALCSKLLSFAIIVNVVGHRVRVHPRAEHPSCTESTPGLVELLYDTGAKTGAILIVIFAMVIPAMEAIFLLLGEFMRHRNCPCCSRALRGVIVWIQHRSKWASPDMFAYTLLIHLVRSLDHDPLILTDARLDVGFACFCAFCVCATAASLGFPLPKLSDDERRTAEAKPPLVLSMIGTRGVQFLTLALAVAFVVIFYVGICTPCMALRINERPLYQPVGPLPIEAKAGVDALEIPQMLSTDVSLQICMVKLWEWTQEGEVNSFIALVMYSVFVIGLTCVDVVLLTVAAFRLQKDASSAGDAKWLCRIIDAAKVMKSMAMLDVACAGVFATTYCMGIYAKIGVIVSTQKGLAILLAAEAIHVLLYHIVVGAADYADSYAAVHDDHGEDEVLNSGMDSLRCCVSAKRLPFPFGTGTAPRGGAYERFQIEGNNNNRAKVSAKR